MKRIVTVFATRGNTKGVKVETEATTWAELKRDLAANNIDYSNMKAIVGETKTSLDLDNAVLPVGVTVGDKVSNNFTLFLSPKAQKAGRHI